MIKVDLITGFLGSGKTTFLKKYARYLLDKGLRIGILENDYGAVNVDMLLLNELLCDRCELEMVSGGCDKDCHRRRFKTKLIAMGMSGYDRVIIEPSGIFDVDEFFDALREEPLDNWYEIGNVITMVDAHFTDSVSEMSDFYLASQAASAGCIILSRMDNVTKDKAADTIVHINNSLAKVKCSRKIDDIVIAKSFEEFDDNDYDKIYRCGYKLSDYVKPSFGDEEDFSTLYFMEQSPKMQGLEARLTHLFDDKSFGDIFRIKGFYRGKDGNWNQLNCTAQGLETSPIAVGQEVFIVIGKNLDEDKIKKYLIIGGDDVE